MFHRIQEGYPDGWPRAVFIDSEGEPSGVRCQPEEAAAIEAGARALIEVAALRGEVERLRAVEAQSKATTAAINARMRSGDGQW